MTARDTFWLCMGLLAAGAIAFVLPSVIRALALDRRSRATRLGAIVALCSVFVTLSVTLYLAFGEPDAVERSAKPTASPHASAKPGAGSANDSLDSATARLAARLRSDGGSDADWELLAQSYEYAGNSAAAAAARAHKPIDVQPPAPPPTATAGKDTDHYRNLVRNNPKDGAAWVALAQAERSARSFEASQKAFKKAIELKSMSADDWADYADVIGTVEGKLSSAGAAIEKALALDARHSKALWLKASLALEEHRYKDALEQWQRLRAVVADSSPDARIVDANIEEARALAKGGVAMSSVASTQSVSTQSVSTQGVSTQGVSIRGTVDIDPSLKQRMQAGATLFVFAKSVDSPGAPLAVLRVQPTSWPVTFLLDDSLAMLPSRRLSAFDKVIVEARLSRSGQAAAQAGDLQATSDVISTSAAGNLALRISKIIS